MAYDKWVTAPNGAVLLSNLVRGYKMPGTILSAEARKRIAECHIKTAEFATSREMLIEIYKAARLSLVKGTLFDSVVVALSKRASELGVTKRGSNNDARLS